MNKVDRAALFNFCKADISHIPQEQIFCSACEGVESNEQNSILLCDGCDIGVHQECYQVLNVDMECDWYCQRCVSLIDNPNQEIQCCLCPETHMILEAVLINDEQYWAHSSCLKWHSMLTKQQNTLNQYVGEIFTQHTCKYCGLNMGFQQSCNYRDCSHYFHIGCLKIKGMILPQHPMDLLNSIIKPQAINQDHNMLYCSEHIHTIMETINPEYLDIFTSDFISLMELRVNQYYKYNCKSVGVQIQSQQQQQQQKQQQKQSTTRQQRQQQRKAQRYDEHFFTEMLTNPEYKDIRCTIKDKKIRQQFQDYMKQRLSEQLYNMRKQFYKDNKSNLEEEDDSYIQLDIQLSKRLFDEIVDVNNLDAFDNYLVNYFIYNNLIDRPKNPIIMIKDDTTINKYWKTLLDELHVKNGEKLAIFLNQLRYHKMWVVSRKNEKIQQHNIMLEHFGNVDNVEIID